MTVDNYLFSTHASLQLASAHVHSSATQTCSLEIKAEDKAYLLVLALVADNATTTSRVVQSKQRVMQKQSTANTGHPWYTRKPPVMHNKYESYDEQHGPKSRIHICLAGYIQWKNCSLPTVNNIFHERGRIWQFLSCPAQLCCMKSNIGRHDHYNDDVSCSPRQFILTWASLQI